MVAKLGQLLLLQLLLLMLAGLLRLAFSAMKSQTMMIGQMMRQGQKASYTLSHIRAPIVI